MPFPIDLDELGEHEDDQQSAPLLVRHFRSKALLELIEEVRRLRQIVDEWSPIVAEHIVEQLNDRKSPA